MLTGFNIALDIRLAKIYRNNIGTPNTVPDTPANLSASVLGNAVTFRWTKSSDNQTAQNTYNLRIGKTPGGSEIMSPMSETNSGYRRVPLLGNTNHNNSWSIKNLAPGIYYWSVQAIDNAFAGSAFAMEQTFTVYPDPFVKISTSLINVTKGSVAWGDYDNDNDLDILLAGQTTPFNGVAKVYRNDAGNFVDIAANLPALISPFFVSVAWGDYDNDNDLDFLLTGSSIGVGHFAKIYRNDNGNFIDIAASLMGVVQGAVAWGDFDNDGDLDVLLTGLSSSGPIAKIYRNDFGSFVDVTAPLIGVRLSTVAWGDFDNDGDLDVLLAGDSSSVFTPVTKIYRNDGTNFVDSGVVLTNVLQGASQPGDYDNDGDLDILLTGYDAARNSLAKIYRNDGGNFVDIAAPIVGVASSSVAWGDYDNDGDLDILLSGLSTDYVTKIYRNDGGSFVDIGSALQGASLGSVAWGDYDHDGDLDLVVTGERQPGGLFTQLYRNDIGIANTAPNPPAGLAVAVSGNTINFSWNKATDNETPINALTYNLRLGKISGSVDIVSPMAHAFSGNRRIPALGNTNHNAGWTIKNLAPGTYYWSVQAIDHAFAGSAFADEQSFTVLSDAFTEINASLIEVSQASAAWGDYDNDGDLDILLAGVANCTPGPCDLVAKVYRNAGGSFVDISASLTGAYNSSVAWGDYDNDGDLDILLTGWAGADSGRISKVYRNDNGNFVDILAPLTGVWFSSVGWGDYDNDGDLDILLIGEVANSNYIAKIYRNDPADSGRKFVDISAALTGVRDGSVAWGDYDNDGDLDILLTGSASTPSSSISKIYRNDAGSFVDISIPLERVTDSSVAWGDYDSDGDLDILLTGWGDNLNCVAKVYRNDGGSFVDILAALQGVCRSSAAWGDYDNDGDLDILLTGNTDPLSSQTPISKVYRNDLGSFVDISASLLAVGWGRTTWGDYDNDGDLDILLTGAANANFVSKVYRNNTGTNNMTPASPINLTTALADSSVTFSWNKSTDNETPSNGLTYNLRLGTTPGGVEKKSPMADLVTGYRRVVQLGNTNHNNSWMIKNLPKGRYYWNVQAIDHAFTGSAFALEQTFVFGDTVWPGDTNNNRVVNQADVLPIGLYWNKTGPKRDNASVSWQGQIALPWSPEAATFADANGDGIVNQADVLPIGLNWGQMRTASIFVLGKITDAFEATAATSTLGVKITGDTNPGKNFWLDVHADSVANLFGLSFELLYAPTTYVHVDTIIAGIWLGDDLVFFSYVDTTAGKISLAVSRKAGQEGKDSSGVIARIKMRMSGAAVHGQVTVLTLQNVAANDPAGNPIQFTVINGSIITSVASRQQNVQLLQAFALHPNFPNPFNPSTMIKYDVSEAAEIRLEIFDMLGRHVRTLVDQRQQAGRFEVIWDGRNESGQIVVSGAYIYQLRVADSVKGGAGKFVQSRKLLLVR